MTYVLTPFPDAESVVRERLIQEGYAAGSIGIEMPATAPVADAYWIRLVQVGGTETETTAYPVVTIDVFAPRRSQAKSLAADISTALVGYARSVQVDGKHVAVGKATVVQSPVKAPYDDSSTARIGATYEFSLRR